MAGERFVILPCITSGHILPALQLGLKLCRHGPLKTPLSPSTPHNEDESTVAMTTDLDSPAVATETFVPSLTERGREVTVIVPEEFTPEGGCLSRREVDDKYRNFCDSMNVLVLRPTVPEVNYMDWILKTPINYADSLRGLLESHNVTLNSQTFFIVDVYSCAGLEVAKHLGVPFYAWIPSSAPSAWLYENSEALIKVNEPHVNFSQLPGLGRVDHIFRGWKCEPDQVYVEAICELVRQHLEESEGDVVICNDMECWYPEEFRASKNFVFAGPLFNCCSPSEEEFQLKLRGENHPVWLDSCPERSVIYISFGSFWDVNLELLNEVAEMIDFLTDQLIPGTNNKFHVLWCLRDRRVINVYTAEDEDENKTADTKQEVEGAQAKTTDTNAKSQYTPKGLNTELSARLESKPNFQFASWVDQIGVFRHRSLGLFFGHGGWNGVLEACQFFGGPIALAPFIREQRLNVWFVETHLKIGAMLPFNYYNRYKLADDEKQTIDDEAHTCVQLETRGETALRVGEKLIELFNDQGVRDRAAEVKRKIGFQTDTLHEQLHRVLTLTKTNA